MSALLGSDERVTVGEIASTVVRGANLTVAGAATFWGPSQEDSEMTERISLEGKVEVVTGAGPGLGRAYVELPPNAVPVSW
jgi:hypothetical protein